MPVKETGPDAAGDPLPSSPAHGKGAVALALEDPVIPAKHRQIADWEIV